MVLCLSSNDLLFIPDSQMPANTPNKMLYTGPSDGSQTCGGNPGDGGSAPPSPPSAPPLVSPPLAPPQTLDGFTFVGCFRDDSNRDLQMGPGPGGPFTPTTCNSACSALNLPYFALQFGGADCWCSDSYSTPAATYPPIAESDCQRDASFPPLYGGPWANAVFVTQAPASPPPPPVANNQCPDTCYNRWGQITTGDCQKLECRMCSECVCRPFCETWNMPWSAKCGRWYCAGCPTCDQTNNPNRATNVSVKSTTLPHDIGKPEVARKQSAINPVLLPGK